MEQNYGSYEGNKDNTINTNFKEYSYEEYLTLFKDSTTSNFESFWTNYASKIHWDKKYDKILDDSNAPLYKWFTGGKISPSYNLFDKNMEKYKDRVMLRTFNLKTMSYIEEMTYTEVFEQIKKTSYFLRSQGIKKGDIVGIFSPSIIESFIFIHSCHRIGAISHGFFENFSTDEIKKRLNLLPIKAIFCASARITGPGELITMTDKLNAALDEDHQDIKVFVHQTYYYVEKNLKEGWLVLGDELAKITTFEDKCEVLDAHDPIIILQTSGTTGEPKCVVYSVVGAFMNMVNLVHNVCRIDLTTISRLTGGINPSWISGHIGLAFTVPYVGGSLTTFQGSPFLPNPENYWKMLEVTQTEFTFMTPAFLKMFKAMDSDGVLAKKYELKNLKVFYMGGDIIDENVDKWIRKILPKSCALISNVYGQTELSGLSSSKYINNFKPGSVGRATMGFKLVEQDEKILVQCPTPPSCCCGFWSSDLKNQSEFLKAYFFETDGKWYFDTGDSGKFDEEGYLYITGRSGDIIKIGKNCVKLAAFELESLINSNDRIIESIAVELATDTFYKLVMIVQIKGTIQDEEIRLSLESEIRQKIEIDYLNEPGLIDRILFVSDVPKNINGKILRGLVKKIINGQKFTIPATMLPTKSVEEIQEKMKIS